EAGAYQVGVFNPATHDASEFTLPNNYNPFPGGITTGPDGNLWYCPGLDASQIGQIIPIPTIASLSPPSVSERSAGFTLTVNGSEFLQSSVVRWNGTSLATTFVSNTQLQATVPGSLLADEGTANLTVSNPVATSNTQTFTVSDALLSASGITEYTA